MESRALRMTDRELCRFHAISECLGYGITHSGCDNLPHNIFNDPAAAVLIAMVEMLRITGKRDPW